MSAQLTTLHQVGARAEDFEETRAFYEDTLGARHIATFDPPGLLFFDFSGVRLLFERENDPAVLYFRVDDIEQKFSTLSGKGVQFDGEPHLIHRDDDGTFGNPGTEEWMAFFKDPGGNTIALVARK
jgi:methylmalonyl-CoA/ethylmalonyl-CoA epimerase